MSRRRKLRPEEQELWNRVAQGTTPLPRSLRTAAEKAETPKSDGAPAPKGPRMTIERPDRAPERGGFSASVQPSDPRDRLQASPLAMDRRTHGKLSRGKIKPEGRIDLHGMTMDRAHPALTRFILDAHGRGKRVVLVITGKGKSRDEGGPIPVRQGVLRHNVPQWLALPPLVSAVLQVVPAHQRHGGSGAYYVYLRRNREIR
ncbi:Smr/MutS family protein [Poseidonocella sedimentorum]|uniref:DNA-nicking endonuclease, Smr domain n=1 Tax=Poseidonocella sedimentorum TaxID=871652 RepID=A0A1I6D6Y5_9RHOB|nr:Smr/MutS family protein [Poseidonocella sedimentorum]SFR01131.1 DNA-nicking endonuclease, Smr domain [Poseidonocella sedimentorum]